MERALLAKVGTFVFAGVLGLPVTFPASGAPVSLVAAAAMGPRAVSVALPFTAAELPALRDEVRATLVARDETEAETTAQGADPVVAAPAGGSIVLASWYGPGFYESRTACGLTLTPGLLGVAHLTLPCGTLVTLTSPAGRTVTVPVIDRGPYVAGRTLDLSYATKLALACSDLCSVGMSIP